jgi:hypothetical protein
MSQWIELDSPYQLVYGGTVILFIIYSSLLPSSYRVFADSLLGRVFGLGFIYIILQSMGWTYALLTALAFLLILPREGFKNDKIDGFNGGGAVSSKEIVGSKWFVEKILGENPIAIETDRVTTYPIDK